MTDSPAQSSSTPAKPDLSHLENDPAYQYLQQAYELFLNKQFREAIAFCESAMTVYQSRGDQIGESCCLVDIGQIYRSQALDYYRLSVDKYEPILPSGFQLPPIVVGEPEYAHLLELYLTTGKWYASTGQGTTTTVSNPPKTK